MGRFIWHEWARLVSITSSVYIVWAGFWGCLFPKFMWDFVDHIEGPNPFAGIFQNPDFNAPIPFPNPKFAGIEKVITGIPLIQILAILMGVFAILFEYPIPALRYTVMHRNFAFKAIYLLFMATLGILFYQGTNATLWSLVAIIAYCRALVLGEKVVDDKPGARGGARGASRA